MKKTLLILFSFFTFHSSFSQEQKKIDSLKTVLKNSGQDSVRVIVLNQLVHDLEYTDSSVYMPYLRESISLSEKINYKFGHALAMKLMGNIYYDFSQFDKALEYYDQSLAEWEKIGDKKEISKTITNIGNVYGVKGDYQTCLNFFLKSLKIDEEIGNKKGVATTTSNIGELYGFQQNNDLALKYDHKALSIYKELGDKKGMSRAMNNIGMIFNILKKSDSALVYLVEAVKLAEEMADKQLLSNAYGNLANTYIDKGDFENAINYQLKTIPFAIETGSKYALGITYNDLARNYINLKKFSSADEYAKKALAIGREVNSLYLVSSSYNTLSRIASSQNDFKNAYAFHKKYSEIKDSLLNEESSKQIAEMQTKYETEKKEQQITLLNKDKELQDAQLNRQKIIIWSVAGGLLVVMTLSIFIFRERRKSEKLLLNILPAETARELKRNGKATARHYESVTVMFTDFKGFTNIAEKLSAEELVSELDYLFKKFDEIISKYNIEKIKTIGDAYMCASGLPTPNSNHAEEIIKAGIEIQTWMKEQNNKWSLRMGIHSGRVTAGVVGDKKFAYDIWGDTVNTASRMESSGEAGRINISGETHHLVKDKFTCEFRGKIPAKNKGEIEMYFVKNPSPEKPL